MQGTHSTDAPFVHYLSKIDALEKEISVEKQKLEELKVTIDAQIDLLDSEKRTMCTEVSVFDVYAYVKDCC